MSSRVRHGGAAVAANGQPGLAFLIETRSAIHWRERLALPLIVELVIPTHAVVCDVDADLA